LSKWTHDKYFPSQEKQKYAENELTMGQTPNLIADALTWYVGCICIYARP
jgi:hypothetical protein